MNSNDSAGVMQNLAALQSPKGVTPNLEHVVPRYGNAARTAFLN